MNRSAQLPPPVLQANNSFFQNHDPIPLPEEMKDAIEMNVVEDAPTKEIKEYPDASIEVIPSPTTQITNALSYKAHDILLNLQHTTTSHSCELLSLTDLLHF